MEVENKKWLIVFIIVLISCSATKTDMIAEQPETQNFKPYVIIEEESVPPYIVCEELGYQILKEEDRPQAEISQEQMIDEIMALWTLFFEDGSAPPDDPRRMKFFEYATFVVDAVRLYQQKNDTEMVLPRNSDVHLLVAMLMTKESSLRPEVVGALGEVGMMQVHGKALAGYAPDKVKENPRIGVRLGVRWLTHSMWLCHPEGIDQGEVWASFQWIETLSAYAAGDRGMKKPGECYKIRVARERVDKLMEYKGRISNRPDLLYEEEY